MFETRETGPSFNSVKRKHRTCIKTTQLAGDLNLRGIPNLLGFYSFSPLMPKTRQRATVQNSLLDFPYPRLPFPGSTVLSTPCPSWDRSSGSCPKTGKRDANLTLLAISANICTLILTPLVKLRKRGVPILMPVDFCCAV